MLVLRLRLSLAILRVLCQESTSTGEGGGLVLSLADAGEDRGECLSQVSFQRLPHLIHQRTDGNPLFMVTVANDLVAQGVLAKITGEWELCREVSERTVR
jgi:hypothetical protein